MIISHFLLVIINNLDILRSKIPPDEADPIALVDPDTVLAYPIP
jgi:hypothetical protein